MKRAIALSLGILFMFAVLVPSLADDASLDYVFFNTLPMKNIEALAKKYPKNIRIQNFYSTKKFVEEANITASEGKGWVLMIDYRYDKIILSDSSHHVIIKISGTGTPEYVDDILNLKMSIIERVGDYIAQAESQSKSFSILEIRNANEKSVPAYISRLADSKGKIDLSEENIRSALLSAMGADSSDARTLQEVGHVLSELDTNGNGEIDYEEIFTTSGPKTSDLINFDSKMMDSVSSQISEATDLTTSADNRAVLAALLTLEYQVQESANQIDFDSPIFVGKSGTIASVAFNSTKGYVVVIYQMNPLTTCYGYSNSEDSSLVKASLEIACDKVWTVSYEKYLEKLAALVEQIN